MARRKTRKDKTQAEHQARLKLIKQYFLQGKSVAEIAELMKVSKEHIYALKYESQRNGTWLSEEEMDSVEKKRAQTRKQETEKRHKKKAKEQKKERAQRVEQEEKRKLDELWQLRELATQGLNNDEMANQMHYSISKILTLKRAAIQQGMWFSKEDLKFYKEQRVKRETEAEIARQKAVQEKIERERKQAERAIKEEQAILKQAERERRRKIQAHAEEYKKLRKAAKKENTLEINGEENVSLEGRKRFVELLMKLFNLGATIPEKDVNLIMNAIYLHTDTFVMGKYLKLLIVNADRIGGLEGAEQMATELMSALTDTKFKIPLFQYRKWIQSRMKLEIIKQLKEQGWNNGRIAEKLDMTSAEVVVLLNSEGKKVDFFGEDGNR